MSSPIVQAIKQVCEERGLSYESVLSAIEAALAAAYRKDFGEKNQNVKVEFDPETGSMLAFDIKTVVEDMEIEEEGVEDIKVANVARVAKVAEVEGTPEAVQPLEGDETAEEKPKFNPKMMLMISEARKTKKEAQIGDEIKFELEVPGAFGRMAAQTAKQVITQKLRETERQAIYDEFKSKEGQILTGVIGRREGHLVLIDLGRATALLLQNEQVENEIYKPGARLKFYLVSVNLSTKGPELIVSRAHPEMLKQIFTMEIPEVQGGVVEIKAVAREAGARSKVAVASQAENIDPIGACIGQRGSRIQTVISELGGEKIDVVKWEEDPVKFIANALAPAKILGVKVNEENKSAEVKVSPDQLSLAIGRGGQNVRLASALTGWRIGIEGQAVEVADDIKATEESGAAQILETTKTEEAIEVTEAVPVVTGNDSEKDSAKAESENKTKSSKKKNKKQEV